MLFSLSHLLVSHSFWTIKPYIGQFRPLHTLVKDHFSVIVFLLRFTSPQFYFCPLSWVFLFVRLSIETFYMFSFIFRTFYFGIMMSKRNLLDLKPKKLFLVFIPCCDFLFFFFFSYFSVLSCRNAMNNSSNGNFRVFLGEGMFVRSCGTIDFCGNFLVCGWIRPRTKENFNWSRSFKFE